MLLSTAQAHCLVTLKVIRRSVHNSTCLYLHTVQCVIAAMPCCAAMPSPDCSVTLEALSKHSCRADLDAVLQVKFVKTVDLQSYSHAGSAE